jgi:dolichol-phosphate mannosyltransferase
VISLLIPCHNERQVLDALHARVSKAADAAGVLFVVLLVVEGFTDGSWERMRALHQQDPRWQALRLARKYGHLAAVSAALRNA